MLLRIAHKLSLISIGYLLPTFIALADSPVIPYNQAPREIQEAISLRILEVENRLETFWHPERTKGFVRAHVEIQTKNRFHLYQDKTSFSTPADDLIGGHPWILKVTSAPVAKPFFDIVTKTLKPSYSGTQVFVLDLELPEDYPGRISTTHQLNLDVHFQACSDSKCLLPSILRLPLPVYMGPQPETKLSWQESIQRLVETQIGSQSYLLLALLFLAGLITAFTPCVYPLYPITLGIFSRWKEKRSLFPLSLEITYCVGMSLSFAILGLISVANGKLFGSATQSPVFLISIGAFVLFSAVILWKGWDFPLPQFIKNWAYNSGNREDQNLYLRAALMGAGLGVVASPCVGPILFVLVAALSSQQLSLGYGFSLFFFYGIGMSSPFLLFSILLRWANKKVQLGPLTPYAKSLSSVLIALTGIYFLYMGAQQTSLWKNQFDSHKAPFEISGLDALNEKSAAIIDFRADWCAACLELEHKTFYTVEMAALLKEKNMKFIKVDVTRTTPEAEALLNQWKVLSLPQIFIRNSQGKLCIQNTLRNFEKFEDFQKRIETAFLDCR